MKYWLKGKRGAAVFFLAIAALVIGGLGWVTLEAFAVEEARAEAAQRIEQQRAEAEFDRTVRLAMWWLDSGMQAELNRESQRPYRHFDAGVACRLVPPVSSKTATRSVAAINFIELVPLAETQPPNWMQQHFLVALDSDWSSLQQLRDSIIRGLALASETPKNSKSPREQEQMLAQLANSLTAPNLWGSLHNREYNQPQRNNESQGQAANPPQPNPGPQQPQPSQNPQHSDTQMRQNAFAYNDQRSGNYLQDQNQGRGQQIDKDLSMRKARAMDQVNPIETIADNIRRQGGKWIVGIPGQLVPLWLGEEQEEQLVLARSIQIGDKHVSQVTMIDMAMLRESLAMQVRELFPQAKIVPVKPGEEKKHSERMMFTAPFALEPGEGPKVADTGAETVWTPLRIGIALAWVAALVALLAVGLGGWSVLNLSERRIAFVSAVTHELRTPLTTLRLYLDMLTSGLVRDEDRRAQYLRTLNGESERLNRLVANVLDFSRLENQRPRLEPTTVPAPELLAQVQNDWQARCNDTEKHLEVDNQLPADAKITTDVKLVQQILGNLIDNACKYSRDAEDARITLRVLTAGPGRIAFEVEDRGPGVPASEKHVIFKPFRRGRNAAETASGGVGLGLSLAQRWARLLGGSLTVAAPRDGSGACFRVELPG